MTPSCFESFPICASAGDRSCSPPRCRARPRWRAIAHRRQALTAAGRSPSTGPSRQVSAWRLPPLLRQLAIVFRSGSAAGYSCGRPAPTTPMPVECRGARQPHSSDLGQAANRQRPRPSATARTNSRAARAFGVTSSTCKNWKMQIQWLTCAEGAGPTRAQDPTSRIDHSAACAHVWCSAEEKPLFSAKKVRACQVAQHCSAPTFIAQAYRVLRHGTRADLCKSLPRLPPIGRRVCSCV